MTIGALRCADRCANCAACADDARIAAAAIPGDGARSSASVAPSSISEPLCDTPRAVDAIGTGGAACLGG